MKLISPAKINLTLDILGKDERVGKHFVNTVMYRYEDLYDELSLTANQTAKNTVTMQGIQIPVTKSNTVFQALDLLGVRGWDIVIQKNIPVQSGLGGGSSNAASILKYFGEHKGIPLHELQKLGAQIGADVPFFLCEEPLAYCEGFGDQLVQSWQIPKLSINLLNTDVLVSTAEAYAGLDMKICGEESAKTEALLKVLNEKCSQSDKSIKESPSQLLGRDLEQFFHNDFESQYFEQHPEWRGSGRLCGSGGMIFTISD